MNREYVGSYALTYSSTNTFCGKSTTTTGSSVTLTRGANPMAVTLAGWDQQPYTLVTNGHAFTSGTIERTGEIIGIWYVYQVNVTGDV